MHDVYIFKYRALIMPSQAKNIQVYLGSYAKVCDY